MLSRRDGVAVALLGPASVARDLARHLRLEVVATSLVDHQIVVEQLARDAGLTVGIAAVPWPMASPLHARCSSEVDGYVGIVSWHGLPTLHERLAVAVAPAVALGAHLLVTAPDPGPGTDPGDLTFIREVAQGIADHRHVPSRSIAWRGETRKPIAADVLATLVEAHGRADVIECPVAPGSTSDPHLEAVARKLGIRLVCIDLGSATRTELLGGAIQTVMDHEAAT